MFRQAHLNANQEIDPLVNQDLDSTQIERLLNSIYLHYQVFMDRQIYRLYQQYEALNEDMINHQDQSINANGWKINQLLNQMFNIIAVHLRLRIGIVSLIILNILYGIYNKIITPNDTDLKYLVIPIMLYYGINTCISHVNHLITQQKLNLIIGLLNQRQPINQDMNDQAMIPINVEIIINDNDLQNAANMTPSYTLRRRIIANQNAE